MDISRINKLMGAYKVDSVKKVEKKENVTNVASEKIEISKSAKDFQTAFSAALKAPDVREDKLAEVAKNQEKITPEQIAEKIINSKIGKRF